jgi:hypothetical protein
MSHTRQAWRSIVAIIALALLPTTAILALITCWDVITDTYVTAAGHALITAASGLVMMACASYLDRNPG